MDYSDASRSNTCGTDPFFSALRSGKTFCTNISTGVGVCPNNPITSSAKASSGI